MTDLLNRRSYHLYVYSYIILLISSMLAVSDVAYRSEIFTFGTEIGIILNIIIVLLYNKKNRTYKLIVLIFLMSIILLETFLNIKFFPLRLIILIVVLLNINLFTIDKLVNLDLKIKLTICTIIPILELIHIVPQNFSTKGYSFGFAGPNAFGGIIFGIVISLLLLLNNRLLHCTINVVDFNLSLIGILFIVLIFSYLTNCRGLLWAGLFDLLFIFMYRLYFMHQIIFKVMIILEIFLFVLSILSIYKFDPFNHIWTIINNILSSRLTMQKLIVQNYPLKLFGQHMPDVNSVNFDIYGLPFVTLDNSYLVIAYTYGFIGLSLMDIIFLIITSLANKCKEYIPFILLISLVLYGCIEANFLVFYMIVPVLYSLRNYNINTLNN